MQERLDTLAAQVARMNKERELHVHERDVAFNAAVADLQDATVLIVTPSGKLLWGEVSRLQVEVEQVDVSVGKGWAQFLPGRKHTTAALTLKPL
jgi:hypothetical protein